MDFGAAFQTWKNVLTRPGEDVFVEERQSVRANLTTAIIWIMVAAVVVAVFSILRALISWGIGGSSVFYEQMLSQMDLPPEVAAQMQQSMGQSLVAGILSGFCGALIFVPIGFLISSGIYWLIAKLLGGTGTFEEQTYLLATFTAPIMIINGVVGVVPILGGCLAIIISIYNLVLSYFALKVAHDFTPGKAIITLLIPVLLIFFLVCCVVLSFASLMGAAFSAAN